MFHVGVNILHESAHMGVFNIRSHGDWQLRDKFESIENEAGASFEYRAFGVRFSNHADDVFTFEEGNNYLLQNYEKHKFGNLYGLTINQFKGLNELYLKDLRPRGQEGDISVTEKNRNQAKDPKFQFNPRY